MRDITISVGESRRSTNWVAKTVPWDRLCLRLSKPTRTQETMAEYAAMSKDDRAAAKDVGGFVGGRLEGRVRKNGHLTDRQLVCLDADFGNPGLIEIWDMLIDKAVVIHSTHSSTPDNVRLRFVIPLSRPVSAAEYEPIARRLAEWIGIEVFDDTTYEACRLMYFPSICSDADYIYHCNQSEDWVDPDEVLASYTDWHDMSEWPISSRQAKIVEHMGAVQGDPLTKPGVIGAFNRAYRITDAIDKYLPGVYTPCGANRWTYTGGTTTGGAVTYDDDTFIYSHHDTDPISGKLCSAFDMIRLHKFGDMDVGSPAELSSLPSMDAMRELCSHDEAVRNELADGIIRQSPEDVFRPDETLQRFADDLTEQGLAREFSYAFGANVRHSKSLGWIFWDGVRWRTDAEPEVNMLALRYTDALFGQARMALQVASGDAERKRAQAVLTRISRLRTSAGLHGMLNITQTIVTDSHPELYDGTAWELNTPDGVIDLRTGDIRAHDMESRHTKCTSCSMGPEGTDMWLGFVDHITGGDVEFATYLQTLAGMAAVGEVYEEGLIIVHGPGGNGKSTFFGALKTVLGDYAKTINADLLVSAGPGKTDQTYVMALRGARLAIMGETEEGAHLSIAQMKRLTSRDVISARYLYKDPLEFAPTHTTIMHTNHLPRLSSLDGGTRRRIAVAPFPSTLPPEKIITNYEYRLVHECGGAILRWIVEGAMKFYSAGCKLTKPKCVIQATNKYTAGEDWLGLFIDECCDLGDDHECSGAQMYATYRRWAEQQGAYVRRNRDFAEALEARGPSREKRRDGRYWKGITVRGGFE